MKKILTMAFAVIVAALALTGCNDQKEPNSTPGSNTSDDSSSVVSLTAAQYVEAALAFNPDEWSGMMNEVTDPEYLAVLFPDIDMSICEDYCFKVDMTGINKHEVLVAKAKAGSEDALKAAFDAYLASLRSPDAMLYPAGQEAVAGAVSGVTNSGYNYVIIHANGENIAAAMTSAK